MSTKASKGVSSKKQSEKTVVVIAGAGARGAYEAAVLSYLLPKLFSDLSSVVLLGTSAGAINAALWASRATPGKPLTQVGQEVVEVWRGITQERVFVNPVLSSVKLPWQFASELLPGIASTADAVMVTPFEKKLPAPLRAGISAAVKSLSAGASSVRSRLSALLAPAKDVLSPLTSRVAPLFDPIHGLLDTTPLLATARQELSIDALNENVRLGSVRGVGVVATSCPLDGSGGRSRIFLNLKQGESFPKGQGDGSIDFVPTPLTREQVLASAAIPLAFPAVEVQVPGDLASSGWYTDGGVRLNTPIQPAVELGADRLIVISSHATTYPKGAPPRPGRPNLLDVAAQSVHAVLADGMIEDLRVLRRANRQVRAAQQKNEQPPARESGELYREISIVEVAPENGVLSRLAAEAVPLIDKAKLLSTYGSLISLLTGAGRGQGSDELLSYLLFEPHYFDKQFQQGTADAKLAWEKYQVAVSPTASAAPRKTDVRAHPAATF